MPDKHERDISKLSTREAQELAIRLSDAGRMSLPLGAGLRAAAEEAVTRRLARVLVSIADAVDRGQSLDDIFASSRGHLTSHVGGLVAAAARTDRFGESLSDLIEHHRGVRELQRVVLASLAYPLIVLSLAFALLAAGTVLIVPQYDEMFHEFELELPETTLMLITWSRIGLPATIGLLGVAVIGFVLVRVCAGRAVWQRMFATVPVFGPMSHWSGVAEWSRLMSILLEQNVPLPEALRMAGDGSSNANLRQISHALSQSAAQGPSLSQLVASSIRLPRLLVPLIKWGEQSGSLSEALRMISDVYVERVRMRSTMFRAMLPPVVFILVALTVGWMISALMTPLVSLIQNLSG